MVPLPLEPLKSPTGKGNCSQAGTGWPKNHLLEGSIATSRGLGPGLGDNESAKKPMAVQLVLYGPSWVHMYPLSPNDNPGLAQVTQVSLGVAPKR